MSDRIADSCKKLLNTEGELSADAVANARSELFSQLELLDGIDALPSRREIQVVYRGEALSIRIHGLQEEVDIRYACVLKSVAIQQGKLQKLWCEDVLIEKNDAIATKMTIPISIVKEAKAARLMIATMVDDASISSADVLAKLMVTKTPALLLVDKNFKIELALVQSLTCEGASNKLDQVTLSCLPDKHHVFTAESAAQKLHQLASGPLQKLSSRPAQERLKVRCPKNFLNKKNRGPKKFKGTNFSVLFPAPPN